MIIWAVEKIKNPVVALIVGIFISFGGAWKIISNMHAEQFRIYELALKNSHDLEKKCLEQKNELQAKENEVLSLRKELEVASGKVTKDKTIRLQVLIEQINDQITHKEKVLASQADIRVRGFQTGPSLEADKTKSDDYLRTEKEIDSLLSRRDQAQKQMIEVNAQ